METNYELAKQQFFLQQVKDYLKLKEYKVHGNIIKENIKELCVVKIFDILGIGCGYNYRNEYFDIYSSVLGEAVCEKLKIKVHIASDNLRFVRYEGINFIDKSVTFLEKENLDEAVLDIFNFVEDNKKLIKIN